MRRSDTDLVFVEAGTVDYTTAWDRQREIAAARIAGSGPDTVLLLEHPDVYTAGRRTEPGDRPVDGTPVIDVDRGGRITWHGPGQLVGYPIVALADPVDVITWVRVLEEALIATCAELGLATGRVAGRSGVWLAASGGRPERKIAAIGIRITRGVSMHGFALNCNPDMTAFDRIVPCGIRDAGVTSLSAELGRPIPVSAVLPLIRVHLADAIDGRLVVDPAAPPLSRATQGAGVGRHPDPALTGR